MSGIHTVLAAFAGVALAVVITILRVWLVNRFAGPSSPDGTTSPDRDTAGRTRRGIEWDGGGRTP